MGFDGIKIDRSEHAQEFVVIGNAEARDRRLSFRARGLHHHLLSLPPGWHVTTTLLAEDHPEGRDAIRAALAELVTLGYVTTEKHQGPGGRWSTTMTVHDKPQVTPKTDNQSPVPPAETSIDAGRAEDGFPGPGGAPGTDFQASARPAETSVSAGGTEDGFPGVGKPGPNRKTVKENGKKTISLSDSLSEMLAAAVPAASEREIEFAITEIQTRKAHGKIDRERAYLRGIIDNGDAASFVADCSEANPDPAEAAARAERERIINGYTDADYESWTTPLQDPGRRLTQACRSGHHGRGMDCMKWCQCTCHKAKYPATAAGYSNSPWKN